MHLTLNVCMCVWFFSVHPTPRRAPQPATDLQHEALPVVQCAQQEPQQPTSRASAVPQRRAQEGEGPRRIPLTCLYNYFLQAELTDCTHSFRSWICPLWTIGIGCYKKL